MVFISYSFFHIEITISLKIVVVNLPSVSIPYHAPIDDYTKDGEQEFFTMMLCISLNFD